MARNESLEELVLRRNKRLLSFFISNGFNIRIVGDEQKPAIILDETSVLSCYVKNFDLFFTKAPFSDEIVRQFKLKHEPDVTPFDIQEAIELCQHRPVYKIRLKSTGLYLTGYNYLNSEDAWGGTLFLQSTAQKYILIWNMLKS
ncbi:MAG: hypothetical protein HC830_08580 [Bacteroidetes bacterium]|nr:hypothetical protein [Bacteroidota bacterium]